MIAKVISGGQAGVDRAALDVAIELNIPHGGFCTKGRRAEDGRIPDRYQLTELPTAAYPPRTRANVEAAHATLILADADDHSRLTGGTKLTFDLAFRQGQKGAGLYLADLRQDMAEDCRRWLRECCEAAGKPIVLNVAGPRESKSPGIYERAAAFLRLVLAP